MMNEKIAHLRALLIDDGWDVERKADALRTLAEIEAAWDALLAPVDVEADLRATVQGLLDALRLPLEARLTSPAAIVLRPLVEDRARLAAVKSAEIAPIIERFQAAFGADTPRAPSFTAAPGEAWQRIWPAFVARCGYGPTHPMSQTLDLGKARRALKSALAAVEPREDTIAADPSAPVEPAEQAYQPTVEMRLEYTTTASTAQPVTVDVTASRILALRRSLTGLRGFANATGRALIDDALVADNGAANGLPADWAITHDFRPGAQDGLPRLADVEAAPVHPDLARRLAGSIATRRAVPAMTAERAREVAAIEARHALAADPDVGIDAQDAHEDRGTLLAWLGEPRRGR